MSRFLLSPDADRDLEEILSYLDELPIDPADTIVRSIQEMLYSIAKQPHLGTIQSEYSRLLGEEVRSRLVQSYRIYYRLGKDMPEVLAILHGARDLSSILRDRFQ